MITITIIIINNNSGGESQTNPIKSFFLCKKKIRKKKKKSSPLFSFGFLGEIDRVSLSLKALSETLSSPSSSSRRHSFCAIIVSSSVGTVASGGGVGVLPLFSTPARAPPPPPRRSKMLPENESKNRIAFWTRIMRKTNAGRPSFVETDKTTTLKKNTKNDDYDILYSSNTLCLNCAFVAANCVVADETANMVFGICDDDDDARWRSKKRGDFREKKNGRFCLE